MFSSDTRKNLFFYDIMLYVECGYLASGAGMSWREEIIECELLVARQQAVT